MEADVIDTLAGIAPGSHLDSVRRTRRAVAREHAQKSYDSLFAPGDTGGFGLLERFAVAVFVAGLHGQAAIKEFYAAKLRGAAATDATRASIDAEIAAAATKGPYGAYPKGPLSKEDTQGPIHRVADAHREALGPRLSAAFEHVHMLVFHPRDAAPPSLQAMLDAGWTTDSVVTLSQLVAFLSFQIRVVAGLKVLAAKS
ncbi:CMD domain protein [Reyranella sp.]|uniref:CMD domain protein n=1 Tax=Reyranella sp. TaxID=1929291 RepID=UPI003D14AB74